MIERMVPRPKTDAIDALIDAVSAGEQPIASPVRDAAKRPRSWRSQFSWDSRVALRVTGASIAAFGIGVGATIWALRVLEAPQVLLKIPAAPPLIVGREVPRVMISPAPLTRIQIPPAPAPAAPHVVHTPAPVAIAKAPGAYVLPAMSNALPAVPVTLPPAAMPAAPAPATAMMMVNTRGVAEEAVRSTLSRYRAAYAQLDASAAAAVWPSVDRSALGHAFGALRSQSLAFDGCDLKVQIATATARCWGTAEYVPRVGRAEPRRGRYEWKFNMRRAGADWQIEQVIAAPVD